MSEDQFSMLLMIIESFWKPSKMDDWTSEIDRDHFADYV